MGTKYLKAALAGLAKASKGGGVVDLELEKMYPAVFEFLTSTQGPDGKDRQTSTLLVFVEPPAFKVCLTERDADLSLWATGLTLGQALASLEARLTDPVVEWRRKRPWTPGKGKAKG